MIFSYRICPLSASSEHPICSTTVLCYTWVEKVWLFIHCKSNKCMEPRSPLIFTSTIRKVSKRNINTFNTITFCGAWFEFEQYNEPLKCRRLSLDEHPLRNQTNRTTPHWPKSVQPFSIYTMTYILTGISYIAQLLL